MSKNYEIINHGYYNCQYFQGCGTAFTDFDFVVTGAGETAAAAYHDAVEQLWSMDGVDGLDVAALQLPTRPRGLGITERNRVPADCRGEDSEVYWYVSIRARAPQAKRA